MIRKPIRTNPRASDAYKEMCRIVRKRDGNKCQIPGCNKTTSLQVHHIKTYSSNGHGRLNPENCVTVCRYHHENMLTGHEMEYASLLIKIVGENTNKQNKKKKK
jgi:hypothetical protein